MKLLKIIAAAAVCFLMAGCHRTDLPVHSATEQESQTAAVVQTSEPSEVLTEEQSSAEEPEENKNTGRAQEILSGMTTEEKAGQLVIGRFPGDNAAEQALKYHLGGYVMFARDFEQGNAEEIRGQIAEIQDEVSLKMLFAVDEEGGSVVRISKFPQYRDEPFPSQSEVLSSGGVEGVFEDAVMKSQLLSSLGLNMNLAPVCDLPRSVNDYIANRAFGTDADSTSAAVGAAVSAYRSEGIICTLKHFPGYGNNSDTHTGISFDERPLTEFEQLDFLPFQEGISEGAPVIMVSHNIVACVDDSLPGSLSPEMYSLLRKGLGFSGVAMTDDLSMEAVGNYCGEEQAAVTAFNAGADLLCCTDYAGAVDALVDAVNSGEISEERIDQSVTRILEMKLEYGIIS